MARIENSKVFVIFPAICLIAIMMTGCRQSWTDDIGSYMDQMAKAAEKFGTMSMSSPLLVRAQYDPNDPNGSIFDFNLSKDANYYFTSAQSELQGASAVFDQFARESVIRGTVNPTTPQDGNTPRPNQAKSVLTSDGFTPYLGLLSGGPNLKISNRSGINTAAGDTVTAAIFKLLGNPAKTIKFDDKLMMFGVSMVTVSPGWSTRKNHTAELSVMCRYDYWPARRDLLIRLMSEETKREPKDRDLIKLIEYVLEEKLIEKSEVNDIIPQRFKKEFREEGTPLSAAVSPMTDVDVLDLSNSQRRQISNALAISAALSHAGFKADAAVFMEWAKRTERDVHTRTPYAAITAFSTGGHFGFRVRPRLKALDKPGLFGSNSENVLEHQTFPTVVIIGIDTDDLQLAFDIEKDKDGNTKKYEGKVKLVAYEPQIRFWQTSNWLPNWLPGWLPNWLTDLPNTITFNSNPKNRISETARLRWASSREKAQERLKSLEKHKKIDENTKKLIEYRISLLKYNTLDSWNTQYIPIELMTKKYDYTTKK